MSENPANKALVIGAGLSGLALAARLAAKGFRVEVFEQNDFPGGKAGLLRREGFVFDTGPSLFTMPAYVDEVFRDCGKDPRDYYRYQQLETLCHYFYEDGTRLNVPADRNLFAEEVERFCGEKKETVLRFLDHSARIHSLTEEVFIRKSLHRWKNYFSSAVLRGLLSIGAIDTGITMEEGIRRYFRDERLVQLFCRYATYNGSDPYRAPGTLNVIPHLEYGLGAYMPDGGISDIPRALHRLGEELGVKFRFGTRVEKIRTEEKRVKGIVADGISYDADTVVSNADIWPSYRSLMPGEEAPEKILSQERSSSAFIFYWGMDGQTEELDVHNIFFSSDYREEFRHLFESGQPHSDPTVYVHLSSRICPGHAPSGKENWFVMINAPQHRGQDWETLLPGIRRSVLAKLEGILKRPVERRILFEETLSPLDIEQRTSSFGGSLYGTSSNSRFAAFLRHPNFSSKLKGLYFCGGSVHPGGGIPLVMASAKIVADLVSES